MAKVLIFAGANGSRKTTLASTVIGSATKFINAVVVGNKNKFQTFDEEEHKIFKEVLRHGK